jgi:hypothetical protein
MRYFEHGNKSSRPKEKENASKAEQQSVSQEHLESMQLVG